MSRLEAIAAHALARAVVPPTLAEVRRTAAIAEARVHLACALSQVVPSDDEILIGHVKAALALLDGVQLDGGK